MRPEDYTPRLAFIRYLHTVASEQSRQPLPMGAASILGFHDSVELFLVLAGEHLNANLDTRAPFDKYFVAVNDALKTSGKDQLSGKTGMLQLNQARVGLKHHGILPAPQEIERFLTRVEGFFDENTPLVFDGTAFGTISLVSLVANAEVRSNLQEAERLMHQGDTKGAIEQVALGFDLLIREFEATEMGAPHRRSSPYFLGDPLSGLVPYHLGKVDLELRRFAESVETQFKAMKIAIRMLTLGLDYGRYAKFKQTTPHVFRGMNGQIAFGHQRDEPPSPDELHFCFDFVVDNAVRLQQTNLGLSLAANMPTT